MKLKPVGEKFVVHWGEMGSAWGVNRTVAQIHALLFFVGRPMHAEEIADTLSVARSNVSNSIKELQGWKLVKAVRELGDRRDYFVTSTDVWALVRTVASERKQREFEPTLAVLNECIASAEFSDEDQSAQERIRRTAELMTILSGWADEMLKLEPETLERLLKMGARVQKVLRKRS